MINGLLSLFALVFSAGEFTTLFDGKTLSGFQQSPGPWVVENGVLTLKGRTDGKMRDENYLWTARKYGDFILDLEFRVPSEANSGVFIRTSDLKDPVQTGIEIQVANFNPGNKPDRGAVGGIYDLVAASENLFRPNAWNRYIITCQGPNITVNLNGKDVARANLDRWTQAYKNPDGSKNKFRRPLKEFARVGYIGFQDHGTPVSYRNIRIQVLK